MERAVELNIHVSAMSSDRGARRVWWDSALRGRRRDIDACRTQGCLCGSLHNASCSSGTRSGRSAPPQLVGDSGRAKMGSVTCVFLLDKMTEWRAIAGGLTEVRSASSSGESHQRATS